MKIIGVKENRKEQNSKNESDKNQNYIHFKFDLNNKNYVYIKLILLFSLLLFNIYSFGNFGKEIYNIYQNSKNCVFLIYFAIKFCTLFMFDYYLFFAIRLIDNKVYSTTKKWTFIISWLMIASVFISCFSSLQFSQKVEDGIVSYSRVLKNFDIDTNHHQYLCYVKGERNVLHYPASSISFIERERDSSKTADSNIYLIENTVFTTSTISLSDNLKYEIETKDYSYIVSHPYHLVLPKLHDN